MQILDHLHQLSDEGRKDGTDCVPHEVRADKEEAADGDTSVEAVLHMMTDLPAPVVPFSQRMRSV